MKNLKFPLPHILEIINFNLGIKKFGLKTQKRNKKKLEITKKKKKISLNSLKRNKKLPQFKEILGISINLMVIAIKL